MWNKSRLYYCLATLFLAAPLTAQDTFREPESKIDVNDWSIECYLRADGSPETCQAYHRVLMSNATQIALVAAFALPAEGAGVLYQISLPLGIDLLAGVVLTIDVDFSVKLPVTRCTLQGCLLEGHLTNTPFDTLMNGTTSTFTVQIPGQGTLPIPMSLNGFGTSIRRIEKATHPVSDKPATTEADISLSQDGIALTPGNGSQGEVINRNQVNGVDPALAPVTGSQNQEKTQ